MLVIKKLVNCLTNLLTNFTANFARRVADVLFRVLVGRAVRGGRHALLRVGESDGEGASADQRGVPPLDRDHWSTATSAGVRPLVAALHCSPTSVFICGCFGDRARHGSVSGPTIRG